MGGLGKKCEYLQTSLLLENFQQLFPKSSLSCQFHSMHVLNLWHITCSWGKFRFWRFARCKTFDIWQLCFLGGWSGATHVILKLIILPALVLLWIHIFSFPKYQQKNHLETDFSNFIPLIIWFWSSSGLQGLMAATTWKYIFHIFFPLTWIFFDRFTGWLRIKIELRLELNLDLNNNLIKIKF